MHKTLQLFVQLVVATLGGTIVGGNQLNAELSIVWAFVIGSRQQLLHTVAPKVA